jgi:GT2 family glycosyltransferase
VETEHDRLIADQPAAAIDTVRVASLEAELGFAAGNKEAARKLKSDADV